MAPNPYRNLGLRSLTGGIGVIVLSLSLEMPISRRTALEPQDSPDVDDRGTEAPPSVFAASADVENPPHNIPLRERLLYKSLWSYHRSVLRETDRTDVPRMMRELRRPPNGDDERELLDWLAERDALIDRALALGYVIGELSGVVSGTKAWSGIGTGRVCGATLGYPIGGHVSVQAPAPSNGDAVLLSRGWVMLDSRDIEPRPHIPIPRWFLRDPTLA